MGRQSISSQRHFCMAQLPPSWPLGGLFRAICLAILASLVLPPGSTKLASAKLAPAARHRRPSWRAELAGAAL